MSIKASWKLVTTYEDDNVWFVPMVTIEQWLEEIPYGQVKDYDSRDLARLIGERLGISNPSDLIAMFQETAHGKFACVWRQDVTAYPYR